MMQPETTETAEQYCPICGKEVSDPAWKRFGKWCCSEAHAEAYVKEFRARREAAPVPRPVEEPKAERAWSGGGRRRGC